LNFITKSEASQYYECGYSCDNGLFLKLDEGRFFVTDARYVQEAEENVKNTEVVVASNILQEANLLIKKLDIKSLVFDPKEFSVFEYETLCSSLETSFVPEPDFMHKKRAIKSKEEIKNLKEAVKLGAEAFESICKILEAGKTEKELSFIAKGILQNYGEFDLSFEPILAFDENAAKPHALPTEKSLQKGGLVLLDAGVKYKRYCSDRTRVLEFGRSENFCIKQGFSNKELQKIYDVIKKAKDEATARAKPGMMAKNLDKIARDLIEKAGYGKYFNHSLGHGVGLDIHEFPFINSKNDYILQENMVFTIEPGIYIPNHFGVRLEDMVVMRADGVEVL